MLAALCAAGMDVARLNLSHGGREAFERRLRTVLAARDGAVDRPLGVLVDTRGPEVRIGAFADGGVPLEPGQRFWLYPTPRPGDAGGVGVNDPGLARDVRPGQQVLLDDGNLTLRCIEVRDGAIVCEVEVGGTLLSGKKVNLPGIELDMPALQPDDVEDIRLAARLGADFVAASFVRSAEDVFAVRRLLEECGCANGRVQVISKIETQQGVAHAEEILRASDGLMVARGDLGVEMPAEEVPLVQKELIRKCLDAGKPVITATQMLESMVSHNRPTRAEASDVANAIFDGSDAVMLSAETAVGRYPLDAVRTMARIAERTEQALPFREMLARRAAASGTTVTDAISYATAVAAQNLAAAAILTVTETGLTARAVAKYRPRNPILAMTARPEVVRHLSVVWGVLPVASARDATTERTLERAVGVALDRGVIQQGDLVVITAGAPGVVHGSTNMLKVLTVGDVVLRGTGMGAKAVTAPAALALGADDIATAQPGDIVVLVDGGEMWLPLVERAGAVITEDLSQTSPVALRSLALGVPLVVGVAGATERVHTGEILTVDARRGLCYRGKAQVP